MLKALLVLALTQSYPADPAYQGGGQLDPTFDTACGFGEEPQAFCEGQPPPSAPPLAQPQGTEPAPPGGVWVYPGDPRSVGIDPRSPPEGWRDPKVLVLVPTQP